MTYGVGSAAAWLISPRGREVVYRLRLLASGQPATWAAIVSYMDRGLDEQARAVLEEHVGDLPSAPLEWTHVWAACVMASVPPDVLATGDVATVLTGAGQGEPEHRAMQRSLADRLRNSGGGETIGERTDVVSIGWMLTERRWIKAAERVIAVTSVPAGKTLLRPPTPAIPGHVDGANATRD